MLHPPAPKSSCRPSSDVLAAISGARCVRGTTCLASVTGRELVLPRCQPALMVRFSVSFLKGSFRRAYGASFSSLSQVCLPAIQGRSSRACQRQFDPDPSAIITRSPDLLATVLAVMLIRQ